MIIYLTKRLTTALLNLFIVSLLVFFALTLVPGNTAEGILGMSATKEQIERFNRLHGLDLPPLQRYIRWLSHAITGDFGTSYRTSQPVLTEFFQRLPITMEVVILSFALTTGIGVAGGIVAAVKQDTAWDHLVRSFAIVTLSIPSFLLLTVILVLPAKFFGYAPPFGAVRFVDDPVANLQLMVPPTFMLALGSSAALMRLTRTAMLDVLRQDYIRTARAKGLQERATLIRHALRNALLPVLTVIGVQVSTLLGGSIILEQILGLPGIGTWNLLAVQTKDTPILMAVTMYAAVVLMAMTVIVDLLYAVLDPRLRLM